MEQENFKPIEATNLETKPLKLAPNVQPDTQGFQEYLSSLVKGYQTEQQKTDELKTKKLEAEVKSGRNDIMALTEAIGTGGQRREAEFQSLGGDTAQQDVTRFTNEIEAEQLASRRKIEQIQRENPGGALRGGQIDLINNIQRESLSKQADLAILQSAALRRFDTASAIADRKVQLELEPLKARLDSLKFFYNENKADLTKAEDRAYSERIRKEEREYNDEKDRKDAIKSYALTAMKNGAPANLVSKVLNAKTEEEAIASLGGYASDPLDRAYKNAQLAKLLGGSQGADSNILAVERTTDKISKIQGLVTDNLALGVSAGALQNKKVLPPGFINRIRDWRADVINVMQTLSVDELGRVKADGVTFGALSDGERKAVGDAASALVSGARRDKSNNFTGTFKLSEKKVRDELDTIQKYLEIDFERKTGVPYSEYASQIPTEEDYANSILNSNPYSVLSEPN